MLIDFSGARAKVDRALDHLNALDADIQRAFAASPYAIGGHFEPDTREVHLYALGGDFPVVDWGVIIGDCLHNLRSSLDHIAWQLALDHLNREPTEEEARQIQFPISDTPEGFGSTRVRRFVSDRTLDVLLGFQPCAVDDPSTHRLAILRDLSNIDKHRVVHPAAVIPQDFSFAFAKDSGVVSHGQVELLYGHPLEDRARIGRVLDVVVSRPQPKMDAQGPCTVTVVLDQPRLPAVDQQPVATVIGQLGEAVAQVVSFFEMSAQPLPGSSRPDLAPLDRDRR